MLAQPWALVAVAETPVWVTPPPVLSSLCPPLRCTTCFAACVQSSEASRQLPHVAFPLGSPAQLVGSLLRDVCVRLVQVHSVSARSDGALTLSMVIQ